MRLLLQLKFGRAQGGRADGGNNRRNLQMMPAIDIVEPEALCELDKLVLH